MLFLTAEFSQAGNGLTISLPTEGPLSVHILFYAGKAEVFVALDISYVVCEGSGERCSYIKVQPLFD